VGARSAKALLGELGERGLQLAVVEIAHAQRAHDLRSKEGHCLGVVLGGDRTHGR
jgi:hypothetical protein